MSDESERKLYVGEHYFEGKWWPSLTFTRKTMGAAVQSISRNRGEGPVRLVRYEPVEVVSTHVPTATDRSLGAKS